MSTIRQKTAILIVALLVSITSCSGMHRARGATTATVKGKMSQDAYVWAEQPGANYGSQWWLSVGNFSGNWTETYVLFNLTSRPAEWLSVELSIYLSSYQTNITGYFRQTSTSWSEDTITWNNRPALLAYEEPVTLNNTNRLINLTTFLRTFDTAPSSTNISLLLNATAMPDGKYNTFDSREIMNGVNIVLIWTYIVADDGGLGDLILYIVIAAGFVGVVLLYKYAGKSGKKKKPAQPERGAGT